MFSDSSQIGACKTANWSVSNQLGLLRLSCDCLHNKNNDNNEIYYPTVYEWLTDIHILINDSKIFLPLEQKSFLKYLGVLID